MIDELEIFNNREFDYGDEVKVQFEHIGTNSDYYDPDYFDKKGIVEDIYFDSYPFYPLIYCIKYLINFNNSKYKNHWFFEWDLIKTKDKQ